MMKMLSSCLFNQDGKLYFDDGQIRVEIPRDLLEITEDIKELRSYKARIEMLTNTIYRMEKVLKAAYDVSLSEDPIEMGARLSKMSEAFEEYKR